MIAAVKRAVDAGAPPGSFLLTGSVRSHTDDAVWPGTGRVVELSMGSPDGSRARGTGGRAGLLGQVEAGFRAGPIDGAPNLVAYLDLALAGGFPEPVLALPEDARGRWYSSYIEQVARRDALTLLRRADPDRLRSYIEVYALYGAGVVDHKRVFTAAGINGKTADGYEALLGRSWQPPSARCGGDRWQSTAYTRRR